MPNLPYQTAAWATHQKVSREIRFPIRNSITVLEVEFTYEGPRATYVPEAFASIEPDYSLDGVTLYLNAQGPLQNIGGGAIRYTRTWVSLPPQQTDYDSMVVDRPVLHDIFSGSTYAVSFDNGVTSHLFTARTAATIGTIDPPATAESGGGYATPGALPHVLISITANSGSATFYADDTDLTIRNALSTAATGSTASAGNFKGVRNVGSLSYSVITTNTTVSALSSPDATVLASCPFGQGNATGGVNEIILSLESANVSAASVRRITTSIAAEAGRYMALWNGDKIAATGKVVATDGSTYSDVQLAEVPGKDFAVTHAAVVGVTASTRYVNGPTAGPVAIKRVSDFYLPGVSSGITTPADIPVITTKKDPVSWLAEIVAYVAGGSLSSYFTTIDGTPMERWLGGPIYQQVTISCQMKDTLETVSVSA